MKALESRPEAYNRTVREIGEMERAGEVFVIRPSEALKIGRMSHDREEIVERTSWAGGTRKRLWEL